MPLRVVNNLPPELPVVACTSISLCDATRTPKVRVALARGGTGGENLRISLKFQWFTGVFSPFRP